MLAKVQYPRKKKRKRSPLKTFLSLAVIADAPIIYTSVTPHYLGGGVAAVAVAILIADFRCSILYLQFRILACKQAIPKSEEILRKSLS